MNRYKIEMNGKTYTYRAEDCEGAMDKLANRQVFGRPLCVNIRRKMMDADTYGEEWAEYDVDGHHVSVTKTTNPETSERRLKNEPR